MGQLNQTVVISSSSLHDYRLSDLVLIPYVAYVSLARELHNRLLYIIPSARGYDICKIIIPTGIRATMGFKFHFVLILFASPGHTISGL